MIRLEEDEEENDVAAKARGFGNGPNHTATATSHPSRCDQVPQPGCIQSNGGNDENHHHHHVVGVLHHRTTTTAATHGEKISESPSIMNPDAAAVATHSAFASPSRFKKFRDAPLTNVVIMGVAFLLQFSAYLTCQSFSTKLIGFSMGYATICVIYGVFSLANFFAPALTTRFGLRRSLFFGALSYAAYLVGQVFYFREHGNALGTFLLMLGSIVCGAGASLLWMAQGKIFTQLTTEKNRGSYFGVFWGLFSASAVTGNLFAWVWFASHPLDTTTIYTFYTALTMLVIAGGSTLLLVKVSPTASTEMEEESPGVIGRTETGISTATASAAALVPGSVSGKDELCAARRPSAAASDLREVIEPMMDFAATLQDVNVSARMLFERKMVLLWPWFFVTSLVPAFYGGFFPAWVSPAINGATQAVYGAGTVIGATIAGQLLQRFPRQVFLWFFIVVSSVTFLTTMFIQKTAKLGQYAAFDASVALPVFVMLLGGCCESSSKAYIYCVLAVLYPIPSDTSRAIAGFCAAQAFAAAILGWGYGWLMGSVGILQPISGTPLMVLLYVLMTMAGIVGLRSSTLRTK